MPETKFFLVKVMSLRFQCSTCFQSAVPIFSGKISRLISLLMASKRNQCHVYCFLSLPGDTKVKTERT